MTPVIFDRFLEEIYSNFGRNSPAHGSPMWKNLARRLENIPDEAAHEVAYAFSEYDTLPMNLGKAILAEFGRWRTEHPDRVAKRSFCPNCNSGTAGWCYAHDADGKNYLLRCTCNYGDDPTELQAPMATREYLQANGLTLGKVINPADPEGGHGQYSFLSPEEKAKLVKTFGLGQKFKPRAAHMEQREYAGAYGYDAF